METQNVTQLETDKGNVLSRLFCRKKFLPHRWLGLAYLIQWLLSISLYFYDYDLYINSPLPWSMPLTGFVQALNASVFFSFLTRQSDPGYYSDRSPMSYTFVVENIFFSSLLLFQSFYMLSYGFEHTRDLSVIENIYVFLPYIVIRPFFAKTRFRDSIANSKKNKSKKNLNFFMIGTYVTKAFYIWAKHFIGFFLNYLRFFNELSQQEIYDIYFLLICSGFATTVSMFLHTLKFKNYIGPKTSFSLYVASYMMTFYSFYQISNVFTRRFDLVVICLGAIIMDFTNYYAKSVYAVGVMILLNLWQNNIYVMPIIQAKLGII